MGAEELLKTYIILYNYGVDSGDFNPLLELFDENSILEFEDDGIGKFEGKDNIGRMLTLQSPSIRIRLSNEKSDIESASADFSDEEKPDYRLGGFKLCKNGNKIGSLYVSG